jgi:prepilin-type N-terminal cleavage/methylation domain-containing protein
MNILFFKKSRFRQGFTLVELLVVLGLFSGIATLSLGSLFNAQTINNRLQETQSILDNINLSIQTVTRDVRFGANFYCGEDDPTTLPSIPLIRKDCSDAAGNGGDVLIFRGSEWKDDRDRVAYYISDGVLFKIEYPFVGASTTLQMTSSDVFITKLLFYVDGAHTSDGSNDYLGLFDFRQPLIHILISGYTKSERQTVKPITFNIQATVSSRSLDNR